MNLHSDDKADSVYLRLDHLEIVDSEGIQPGIVLDFNEKEQVVGIEILRVATPLKPSRRQQLPRASRAGWQG